MSIPIFAGKTLAILVQVKDDTGAVKVITGATITAKALLSDAKGIQTTISATVVITDGSAGEFTATFAANVFTFGKWIFQADVVIGSEEQVVVEKHIDVALAHV